MPPADGSRFDSRPPPAGWSTAGGGTTGAPGPGTPEADDGLPDLLLNRYRVTGVLGRGSFGTVYAALDEELRRKVAIKVLHRVDSTAAARFLREAKLIGSFDHPHLVKLHETANRGDRLYLVQEFVEGASLADISPLPPRAAAEALLPIARAAAYAHERGAVHRDIKPDNVLMGDGRPRLIDFGIAQEDDGERLTQTGQAVATPMFAPPEQLSGKRCDARADVYGLGATLYYALTRRAPFESMLEVFRRGAERPSVRVTDVPPALDAICLRCLAKRPEGRYPTAAAVADELEAFLDGTWRAPQRAWWKLWPAAALVAVAIGLGAALRSGGTPTAPADGAPPPAPPPPPAAGPAPSDAAATAKALEEAQVAARRLDSYRAPLEAFARARRAAGDDPALRAQVAWAETHYLFRRARYRDVLRRVPEPSRARGGLRLIAVLAQEELGREAQDEGLLKRSRRELRALAESSESDPWALCAAALRTRRTRNAKRGVPLARRALELAGSDDAAIAYARYAEGCVLLAAKRHSEARGPLVRACRRIPDHPLFHAGLGAARLASAESTEERRSVLGELDLAVRLSEPNPPARVVRRRAVLWSELSGPPREVLAELERVVAHDAQDGEALFWRGVAKYRLRRLAGGGAGGAQAYLEEPKAEADWRAAWQLDPRGFPTWQRRLPAELRRDIGAAVGR